MSRSNREDLLQDAIETAVHFLEKRGEFFPFAVVMTNEGEIKHLQAMMPEERPQSDKVIELIVETIRNENPRAHYRCVGVVSNVKLADREEKQTSDAIRVQLDDSEVGAAICFIPYVFVRDAVELGEIVATKAGEQLLTS